MVDLYDQYLATILVVMVLGVVAGSVMPVSTHEGVAASSVLASLIILEMLFRNPPSEPAHRAATAFSIVGFAWILTLGTGV